MSQRCWKPIPTVPGDRQFRRRRGAGACVPSLGLCAASAPIGIQSCSAPRGRHAQETLQAVGGKETGRFKLLLHRIANDIIAEAAENGCPIIAFEELTGIRDRLPEAS